GLVATLALLGSAMFTLAVGWLGARIGDRRTLLAASLMMMATGNAYALSSDHFVILLIAFFGMLNPSSGSASLFVPPDPSMLPHGVAESDRWRAFARYGLIGALAGALGSLLAGAPDMLTGGRIDRLTALRVMFLLYAGLGVLIGLIYSRAVPPPPPDPGEKRSMLGPSRGIVLKLMALFSLDS